MEPYLIKFGQGKNISRVYFCHSSNINKTPFLGVFLQDVLVLVDPGISRPNGAIAISLSGNRWRICSSIAPIIASRFSTTITRLDDSKLKSTSITHCIKIIQEQ